ncbi:MAG: hypothetical protein ACRDKB_14225, partial [Actinomycetota bacterium]
LVASVMATGGPVRAQDVPEIPAEPNITDPPNDANYINEGTAPGLGHNHEGPRGVSTVADLLAIWFTHDAESISVHFQTVAAPPASVGITYQAFTSPGEGEAGSSSQGCLRFLGTIPGSSPGGGTYFDDPWIRLLDRCNVGTSIFNDAVDGEFTVAEGPEGTGITTFKFPRSYSPLLEDGQVLTDPTARGSSPTVGEHTTVGFATTSVDDTEVGTEYTITGEEEKAKKKDKKKKIKGKKGAKAKKKKKGGKGGKKAAQCKAFQPGELGAEADTIKITDAATEEEPVEQPVALDASLADFLFLVQDPSRTYFNVQIDSKNPNVGLYALFEFPTRRDYDLELLHPDGSYAARSHDFNPFQETPAGDQGNNEGHGGESTASTEKLVGIGTNDCGGWTVEAVNWLGEGGEFPIKLWLGPVENEPQPEGEEPRD